MYIYIYIYIYIKKQAWFSCRCTVQAIRWIYPYTYTTDISRMENSLEYLSDCSNLWNHPTSLLRGTWGHRQSFTVNSLVFNVAGTITLEKGSSFFHTGDLRPSWMGWLSCSSCRCFHSINPTGAPVFASVYRVDIRCSKQCINLPVGFSEVWFLKWSFFLQISSPAVIRRKIHIDMFVGSISQSLQYSWLVFLIFPAGPNALLLA